MLFRISPNQGQPHYINRMSGAVLRIKACLIIPINLLCNKFVLLVFRVWQIIRTKSVAQWSYHKIAW